MQGSVQHQSQSHDQSSHRTRKWFVCSHGCFQCQLPHCDRSDLLTHHTSLQTLRVCSSERNASQTRSESLHMVLSPASSRQSSLKLFSKGKSLCEKLLHPCFISRWFTQRVAYITFILGCILASSQGIMVQVKQTPA